MPSVPKGQNCPVLDVSRRRFGDLVQDALDALPPAVVGMLDNVVVRVEDRNADEPSLLGLYEGIALTERDSEYSFALPDAITLYRLAIVDICQNEDDVRHEVSITVMHELGHHFGIDDERLHELGWG
jgi:predicted Zn-dependent protease with MMP-like domain